jgi:hypothetical protein
MYKTPVFLPQQQVTHIISMYNFGPLPHFVGFIVIFDELVELFPDDIWLHPPPKPTQGLLGLIVSTTRQ